MIKTDLNSDLGESFGAWTMGDDAGVLSAVSSANVACGYHAGDPVVMRDTVKLCVKRGVAIGAHISYPDLMGFGRRNMTCSPDEIYTYSVYQIGALQAFCAAAGTALQHVKPHGAMYNQAAKDAALADAIAAAIKDSCGPAVILMGLANSQFEEAAKRSGIRFAAEAFADRAYMDDGSLVPRNRPGAVLHDPEFAAERVLQMVTEGKIKSIDGATIEFKPDTICMHGDTAEAVHMAQVVRKKLEGAGIGIAPMRDFL